MGTIETPKTPVKAAPKTALAVATPTVQEGITDAARQFRQSFCQRIGGFDDVPDTVTKH